MSRSRFDRTAFTTTSKSTTWHLADFDCSITKDYDLQPISMQRQKMNKAIWELNHWGKREKRSDSYLKGGENRNSHVHFPPGVNFLKIGLNYCAWRPTFWLLFLVKKLCTRNNVWRSTSSAEKQSKKLDARRNRSVQVSEKLTPAHPLHIIGNSKKWWLTQKISGSINIILLAEQYASTFPKLPFLYRIASIHK